MPCPAAEGPFPPPYGRCPADEGHARSLTNLESTRTTEREEAQSRVDALSAERDALAAESKRLEAKLEHQAAAAAGARGESERQVAARRGRIVNVDATVWAGIGGRLGSLVLIIRRPQRSTLIPYTTFFRSVDTLTVVTIKDVGNELLPTDDTNYLGVAIKGFTANLIDLASELELHV